MNNVPDIKVHVEEQHKSEFEENLIIARDGWCMVFITIGLFVLGAACIPISIITKLWFLLAMPPLCLIAFITICKGLITIEPNEAIVCQFFGTYVGTIRATGFFWLNPFYTTHHMSLKGQNFETTKSKVNDANGTPVIIQCVVVWRIKDTAQAMFEVESYRHYIHVQSESAMRACAALFPYETTEEGQISLRSNPIEVANSLRDSVQARVTKAGLEIVEAKISYLAYSTEIAAAMLRKQQASAVIAARKEIVKGAVSMVQMAIDELETNNVADLDKDRKA